MATTTRITETIAALLLLAAPLRIDAFSIAKTGTSAATSSLIEHCYSRTAPCLSSSSSAADDFSAFETSLEDDANDSSSSSSSSSLQGKSKDMSEESISSWQDNLESLLDPTTPLAQRQGLFRELLSSNQEIQSSVQSAIRDRTIDPLLTPTGKRLQEGSRAVARQLTSDILPELVQPPRRSTDGNNAPFIPPVPPLPGVTTEDLQKVGNRLLKGLQSRFQTDLEAMQSDLSQDPLRSIPQRITQQSKAVLQEAANVFAETPANLLELPYTLVEETADYEIRDYEGYTVASTNVVSDVVEQLNDIGDNSNNDDTTSLMQYGAAWNTLAAFVLGANKAGVAMEMTTPVITVSTGELRFYLNTENIDEIPEPLEQDESTNVFEKPGSIWIQEVPPARLAVRRFSGFATKGEVARQKTALLASLDMDNVELDVPHGATVPHVVFQYNPPYTVPVLRRNEIAVAVMAPPTTANGWSQSVDG